MQTRDTTPATEVANEISAYNAAHAGEEPVTVEDLYATLFEIASLVRSIQRIATFIQSSGVADFPQEISDINILTGVVDERLDAMRHVLSEMTVPEDSAA